MEPATGRDRGAPPRRRGGAKRATLPVSEERVLTVAAPAGSRFRGYEDHRVQDLQLRPRVIRYRRERWRTPDGQTLMAPLPAAGVRGHFGPELRRFVLLQHQQGQVTAERITAFLTALGFAISKRQVVRLLTGGIGPFIEEAGAVLRMGLETARWITVDDTGTRHRARNGVTTQLGDDRFTAFATGPSKSRRNFLEILRADHADYVVEVLLGRGEAVAEVARALGVNETTYYCWRAEYGGMKASQAKRLKDVERENARLRRAVADLTRDKLILQEAAEGNRFSIRGAWVNPPGLPSR